MAKQPPKPALSDSDLKNLDLALRCQEGMDLLGRHGALWPGTGKTELRKRLKQGMKEAMEAMMRPEPSPAGRGQASASPTE
jgi:hypothetical protein